MEEKVRGSLLTFWLVLMLVGSVFSLFGYLFASDLFVGVGIPLWTMYLFGFLDLFGVILVIFLFKWKKWAFYVYCGVAGVVVIVDLIIGAGLLAIISGLISPLILYLIIRPKWSHFE